MFGRGAGRRVRQSAGLGKLRQTKVEGETLELLEVVVVDVLHGVAKGEVRLELTRLDFGDLGERRGFVFLIFVFRMA